MTRTSFALSLAASLAFVGLAATPDSLAAQGRGQAQVENRGNAPGVDRSILTVPENSAQSRNRGEFDGVAKIPPGHLPPRGMCRIWIDGVPPGRQARPTDCRTAMRNRPSHGRVIYSDGSSYPSHRDDRWDDRRDDRRDCVLRDRYGNVERDRNGNVRYDRDCERDRSRGRDRDRWDDRYDRDDWCLDRNDDGRCDYANGPNDRRRARSLPEMISTIILQSGRRSSSQERWLGSQRVTARFTDADRNRVPERITWLDSAGRIVQVWVDSSRDGRADYVELYRDWRRVQVIR